MRPETRDARREIDSGDLVAVVLNARISKREQGALLDALFERDEARKEIEVMKARLNQADARAVRNWAGHARARGMIDWQNVRGMVGAVCVSAGMLGLAIAAVLTVAVFLGLLFVPAVLALLGGSGS